jgi:transcription antitermination factor NusG
MGYRWYVAQALAGLEATAIYHLSREGVTAFSPTLASNRQARLFPGYVFVELASPDEAGVVNRTRGIHKVLPVHSNNPLALPDGFVDELRGKISNGAFDEADCLRVIHKYIPGESVPIVAGSFAGWCGEMVRYHKGSMIVLLALFGNKREVIVPRHCVAMAA